MSGNVYFLSPALKMLHKPHGSFIFLFLFFKKANIKLTREPVRNNCCCILINHVRQQTSHYINKCLINSDFYNFNSWNQSQKTTTRRLQVIKLLSGRCALRCSDANDSLSTSQWVKKLCVCGVCVGSPALWIQAG